MEKLDFTSLRDKFPALHQSENGRKRIFFDGAAGTQLPQVVLDEMMQYMISANANYGGYFKTSVETDEMLIGIRKDVADFINAPSWEEIILGPNMTTLTFNMAWALSRQIREGDEVVVTRLDHGANIDSWKSLKHVGADVRYIEIKREDCTLDYDMAAETINPKTKLVAVGLSSNAVGTVNDVKRIVGLAHRVGALVYIDAVHHAPHFPIDVQEIGCDFLVYSAYKCFGPHVGFLWGKKNHLEKINPYRPWPAYDKVPQKYNVGTPNMEGFAGARAAIRYLEELGDAYGQRYTSRFPSFRGRRLQLKTAMAAISEYEYVLSEKLNSGLKEIKKLKVYGITDSKGLQSRCPTYSFTIEGMTSADICKKLSDDGIYVWNGEDGLGALELVEFLDIVKIGGLLWVSIEHYNTVDEIERFLEVLEAISK
jgi:cysteine desulfurase family protein (TIGR01976 family)